MLILLAAFLTLLWAFGLIYNIGGNFIHLLLFLAAIVYMYDLLVSRDSSDK